MPKLRNRRTWGIYVEDYEGNKRVSQEGIGAREIIPQPHEDREKPAPRLPRYLPNCETRPRHSENNDNLFPGPEIRAAHLLHRLAIRFFRIQCSLLRRPVNHSHLKKLAASLKVHFFKKRAFLLALWDHRNRCGNISRSIRNNVMFFFRVIILFLPTYP